MTIKNIILNLILPSSCAFCGKPGTMLCPKCKGNLNNDIFPMCIICENPSIEGITHKYCKRHNPLAPDRYLFDCHYNYISKKIIHKSKSQNYAYKYIETILTKENIDILKALNFNIIIPIPPSPTSNRLKDIVKYMSELISKPLNIPIKDVLKTNGGKTQKKLNKENRTINAYEKFYLPEKFKYLIKGQSILLLDDVNTTGSTLLIATKLLKTTGAKMVTCYTLCKDLRYN
jgi:predicted amidophosphoribosyltransferase